MNTNEGAPQNNNPDSKEDGQRNSRFIGMLESRQASADSLACVGLDSSWEELPEKLIKNFPGGSLNVPRFNREIVESTHDLVSAYKIDPAFYLYYPDGLSNLIRTCSYIKENHPEIPLVIDAKVDAPHSTEYWARMAFDLLRGDAITVNPYMGRDVLEPFLGREGKGVFVLCKTSNKGSGELQDLKWPAWYNSPEKAKYLYERVAEKAAEWNKKNGNCGTVVGATYPRALRSARTITGNMPILVPAVGMQQGELASVVKLGMNNNGLGIEISASRSIIFASAGENYAEAARRETLKLKNQINQYRQAA